MHPDEIARFHAEHDRATMHRIGDTLDRVAAVLDTLAARPADAGRSWMFKADLVGAAGNIVTEEGDTYPTRALEVWNPYAVAINVFHGPGVDTPLVCHVPPGSIAIVCFPLEQRLTVTAETVPTAPTIQLQHARIIRHERPQPPGIYPLIGGSPGGVAGTLKTHTVAQPAAGAEWTATVPAGVLWYVRAIYAILTTSATVATRYPTLDVTDGIATFAAIPPCGGQVASLVYKYSWAEGYAQDAVIVYTAAQIPLPHISPLSAGCVISSATNSLQSGDQWSVIALRVLEVPAPSASEVMLP